MHSKHVVPTNMLSKVPNGFVVDLAVTTSANSSRLSTVSIRIIARGFF